MRKAQSPADLGFNGHDRRRLAQALKHTQDAKTFRRIQAVLLVAKGYTPSEVASITNSHRRSVYYWVNRYLKAHRVADLYDVPRSGRPITALKITAARILHELQSDPLRLGYNTTVWTVALLASRLSQRYQCRITPRTLRRRMKELGLRWKRPRHAFSNKEPHLAQKKGLLSDA